MRHCSYFDEIMTTEVGLLDFFQDFIVLRYFRLKFNASKGEKNKPTPYRNTYTKPIVLLREKKVISVDFT